VQSSRSYGFATRAPEKINENISKNNRAIPVIGRGSL
jgi:hypothetical protein